MNPSPTPRRTPRCQPSVLQPDRLCDPSPPETWPGWDSRPQPSRIAENHGVDLDENLTGDPAHDRGPSDDQSSSDLRLRLAVVLSEEIPWTLKLRLGQCLDRWHRCDAELASWLQVPERLVADARRGVLEATPLVDSELERARERGVRILTPSHREFPHRLHDLPEPPVLLYLRAAATFDGQSFAAPSVAIVGPRNADPWALQNARSFAGDLAEQGVVVVSGFARGVDIASHLAASEVGCTVAVLGCGVDVAYPSHYRDANTLIERGGAMLSEFPLGCEPQRWHFPLRNRIIAALGDATLVIQASKRSGSLLTAHAALDLGRDVWAIPGRISDARSAGTNLLLRDGAAMALRVRDLIETLPAIPSAGSVEPADAVPQSGAEDEQRAISALRKEPLDAEQFATALGLELSTALALLGDLELQGVVCRTSNGHYRIPGKSPGE